jgi:plasmid stability protein
MHRTNIYLTDEQRDALATRAQTKHTSVAELVRQFIDQGLEQDDDDLEADLAAIKASFGAWRGNDYEPERSPTEREKYLERLWRA